MEERIVTFASLAYERKKKKTRREQFLDEMDRILPWGEMVGMVRPYYPVAGNGRQPMPLERMLRIYCLQLFNDLSDPKMEDELYDIESMRRFAGIDLEVDAIPDETTILNFRHLLEEHHLTEKIFEHINRYLSEKGLFLKKGTIVDATIVTAPSSTKNRNKSRDKEMKSTRKGNNYYFGMKAHVGTDTERGLVHSVVVTDASVHDSQVMDSLVHGEEEVVYGDRAYSSEKKRQEYEARGVKWEVNIRGSRWHQLNEEEKAVNHQRSQVRAKGEHAFRIMKHLWHHEKVRYKGLYKNTVQMFSLFALANLYLVRHDLLDMRA